MVWDKFEESIIADEIRRLNVRDLGRFFNEHLTLYKEDDKAFSTYMRHKFREKGISQKDVFKKADMSEGYGYKIISQEKRTAKRDVIIRLCLALRMNLEELQRALELGDFPALCINRKRDVILMVAINNKIFSIDEVNKFLQKYNESVLYDGSNKEE